MTGPPVPAPRSAALVPALGRPAAANPGADRAIRPSRAATVANRVCFWLTLAAVTGAAEVTLQDPDGLGATVSRVTSGVLLLAFAFGPVVRGARPVRIRTLQTVAGVCLAATCLDQLLVVELTPFEYSDVPFFAGYALLVCWLVALTRGEGRRHDEISALDAAAATVGVALGLWSAVLAPFAWSDMPSGAVWAAYPALDVVLLSLSLHLVMRRGGFGPALTWFIGGVVAWFFLDTIQTVSVIVGPGEMSPWFDVGYLYAHFALAVAMCHPRVVQLWPGRGRPPVDPRAGRVAALAVFTVSPAILAMTVPFVGVLDAVVRIFLVVILLGLFFVRLARTVDSLSRAEADSRRRATHDALTGLINRPALLAELDARLVRDHAAGATTAVLFLDCDDFKHVNDTWGHSAGDALLVDIARRLPAALGEGDVLGRPGSDEFVVVTTVDAHGACDAAQRAADLAEGVRRFFDDPCRMTAGRPHAVVPSLGVAWACPGDDVDGADLLGRADLAMYEAKRRGKGRWVVFDEELGRAAQVRAVVADRLGQAIAAGRIDLAFQPVMGGPGYGTLLGWEALARWNDEELGQVPPDVFIAVAEEFGLVVDLGEQVLRRACRELARFRAARPEADFTMSINVSSVQLRRPEFPDIVVDAAARAGVPPSRLHLEITESLLVDSGPAVLDTVEELRRTGAALWIDDFGTGYASLATMLRLPVDCVKIDRSLVTGVGEDPDAARRLGAVLALVHSLGLEGIVAEGVEGPGEEAVLARLGCPMVQGWRYGRPAPLEAVLEGLRGVDQPV